MRICYNEQHQPATTRDILEKNTYISFVKITFGEVGVELWDKWWRWRNEKLLEMFSPLLLLLRL
jgi:hypothetical protein